MDFYLERCRPMYPIRSSAHLRSLLDASSLDPTLTPTSSSTPAKSHAAPSLIESIICLYQAQAHLDKDKEPDQDPDQDQDSDGGQTLLDRLAALSKLRERDRFDPKVGPDVDAIVVPFHLFIAYIAVEERATAWVHLQEALSMMIASIGRDTEWESAEAEEQAYRLYSIL